MLADAGFVPTVALGWRAGFGNFLDKELGSWWRTRRWLIHLVLWLVVINGFVLLVGLGDGPRRSAAAKFNEVMEVFFQVGGFFGVIGAVLVSQGSILSERHSGTAAWVLTKPVSRAAFVLAKVVAISVSFLTLCALIPSLVLQGETWVMWRTLPYLGPFLEGFGLLVLHYVFYIVLAIMLGTLLNSRGAVAGVALGFWLSGNILPNLLPKWVLRVTPWSLTKGAGSLALWHPFPIQLWQPALATLVLSAVALGIALWRFEREEL